jgi:hypothetical protein
MWRRLRLAALESKLKLELVANGYSADDIVRIVQATSAMSSCAPRQHVAERHPARNVAVPANDAIRARY